MENPIKMDDLGVPLFLETSNYTYHFGNSPDSDGPKNLGNFWHLHGNFWQFWLISRIPHKHPGLFVVVVGIQVDILNKCWLERDLSIGILVSI